MVDRVAVFVDAGYLFAQGSKEISGRQLRRGEISLDHQALIRALKEFCGENIRTSIAADLLVRRHFSRPDISAQYLGGSSGHESTSRVREFRGTTKGRRFPDCDGHDLIGPQPCDGGLCPPFGRRRSQGRCPAGPGIRGAGSSPRNQTRTGKPIPVSSPGSGLVARMELRRPSHVPGMRPRWSRADGRGWSVGVTGASIQSGYRGRTPGQGRAVGSWAEDTMASCETSGR